jgi:hypothetical protein
MKMHKIAQNYILSKFKWCENWRQQSTSFSVFQWNRKKWEHQLNSVGRFSVDDNDEEGKTIKNSMRDNKKIFLETLFSSWLV